MKLQFIENIERDIKNWQKSITANSYGVDWKKFLPEDILAENVRDDEYLKDYLEKKFYQSGKVSEFKKWIESAVNSSQIQKDLEALMDKKFPFENVKVFITTFHRAPYDVEQKFFYLIWCDSNKEKAITGIYHELMHFLFHIYYWDMCKKAGFSEIQTHDIKESLTALINPILKQRGLPLDFGYPNHQILRANLEKLRSEEKNFEIFLKKALSHYSEIRQ